MTDTTDTARPVLVFSRQPDPEEALLYIGVYGGGDNSTESRTLEIVFTSASREGERAFSAEFEPGADPLEVFASLAGLAQRVYQRYMRQG